MTDNGHETINITADEVEIVRTVDIHALARLALAAVAWLSAVALVFLLLLGVVPSNWGSVSAMAFFLAVAFASGVERRKRQGGDT